MPEVKDNDFLEPGMRAPAFTLPNSSGGKTKLSSFKGEKTVVLYFYPRDMTSGCTKEACSFRDEHRSLAQAGVVVLGVSPDPVAQHVKFVEKHDLNFELLADEDHSVAEKYGAWRLKKNYGREYHGIQRSTFIIDKSGKVVKVWKSVKPEAHAQQVKKWIEENQEE